MAGPEVYDKAEWHLESCAERDLDPHQAYVHTGLFLGWLVEHDMLSAEAASDAEGIGAFRARELTGPSLYRRWGGVLAEDMLSDEGNAFCRDYFDFDDGQFLDDYHELLSDAVDSEFHVADTWESFDVLSQRIDSRHAEWRSR